MYPKEEFIETVRRMHQSPSQLTPPNDRKLGTKSVVNQSSAGVKTLSWAARYALRVVVVDSFSYSTRTPSAPSSTPFVHQSIIQKNSILRGDLRRAGGGQVVVISMGRFCTLEEACLLRPPYKTYKSIFSYYPMKVGDYVRVGARSIVEAASLGTGACIGKDCIVVRDSLSLSRLTPSDRVINHSPHCRDDSVSSKNMRSFGMERYSLQTPSYRRSPSTRGILVCRECSLSLFVYL